MFCMERTHLSMLSCDGPGWVVLKVKVPLHITIRSCGALRLPCTSANRNVWRVSRMFRADENRMTWH